MGREIKTTIKLLLILVFIAMVLLVAGCTSKEKSLVGIWKISVDMKGTLYEKQVWEFTTDNLSIETDDKIYKGTYKINKNKIIMELREAAGDRRVGYGIYSSVGNELKIKVNEKGEENYPENFNEEDGYDLISLIREQ